MRIAFVGVGFVADYYMTTLANHPALTLVGVHDRDAARLKQFCDHYGVASYPTLQAVLDDDAVELVVNLTDPHSHFDVTLAALEAGKHVYSEKPLAMSLDAAQALVECAIQAGLVLAGAPANALSDAFALTRQSLESGDIGRPRLVYAEMEDGAVFRQNWRNWRSLSGAPWPGRHEFKIGCTLEHAGYALTWLIGLFGPIRRMTGVSGLAFEDKGADLEETAMGPDFSTAVLEFDNRVIARLTCGLCAPRDRSLTVMGEKGTLTVADLWDHRSTVRVEKPNENPSLPFRLLRRLEAMRGRASGLSVPAGRRVKSQDRSGQPALPAYPSQIDFAAGIMAAVECTAEPVGAKSRLAGEALHVTEAALALNGLAGHDGRYTMTTDLGAQ